MELPSLNKPHFSSDGRGETIALSICWAVIAVCAFILVFFWQETRSYGLILSLYQWTTRPVVEYFFRAFTFLGDDEFYMLFLGVILWCVSKPLSFWTAFVLLTSGTCSNLIKDVTLLPRPDMEGVTHPDNSAFPSGHTLTAVTVWGYMAVRLKKTGFWIWAIFAVVMVAFSRMVLAYHFLGDILGGLAIGILFVLLFIWLSRIFYEKGWVEKCSFPLLMVFSVSVPVLLMLILPGGDSSKMMGMLAGLCAGYLLEKHTVRAATGTHWYFQLIKALLGAVVLFAIVFGLGEILTAQGETMQMALRFFRYALGAFWVTFLAPALFVAVKLTPRETSGS